MNRSFETTHSIAPPPILQNNNVSEGGIFSGKNLLIGILTGLLILSFLGINLLLILGDWIQTIISIFGPLFTQILSVFGYTAGTVLDKTEDVATSVAKAGIDIAGGTVQSVADLLKNSSVNNVDPQARSELDKSLNSNKSRERTYTEPEADNSHNPIQNSIASDKNAWCLVGEYQGKRGCIEVDNEAKCMSGQVFPTQQMCLNPTKTAFMHSQAM